MLDELPCVWNGLFSESDDYSFGYNDRLLSTSIAHEYSNLPSSRDVLSNKPDPKLFSLKRVLGLILESSDQELTNEALDSLFKLREELIATFTEVSNEQGFEELLSESIKLIIVDAFNRKAKEGNPEFSPTLSDVSNVKKIENFLKVTSEITALVKEIEKVNKEIVHTNAKIDETKGHRRSIDEQLLKLENLEYNK